MIPSSDQIASDSSPYSSRMRADSARPQAAWTRPPYGESTHSAPVADLVAEALEHDRAVAGHDARRRLLLAQERRAGCVRRALVEVVARARASAASCSTAQRENAPIASPSSRGRPDAVALPERHRAGRPGAGVTITRSRVISSIRQVEAPSRNVWPGRAS